MTSHPIPIGFYTVAHNETTEAVLGLESWQGDDLGGPTVERVTWALCRVLLILDHGDVILQHSTGVRGTWPRIDRIPAKYVNEYEWRPILVPERMP